MSTSSSAHPAGALGDDAARYTIERKIGEGGAGTVYLARDSETGEHVALKRLLRVDAKSVLRLKREFRSLVAINHPNIVKLYDMGRTSDGWFLTMEYLDGTDLTSYLAASEAAMRRTSIGNARLRLLTTFAQLASGVHVLHQASMLHRDLKPSNVLVVDHRVVVLDFGLVRDLDAKAATLTEDGSVAGTPAYMAPEQLLGKELSAACDWYAFGVMLYEALSGVLPIDGKLVEILRRKLETDPTPIAELAPFAPPEVLELCMALLRRDPSARPDAQEILRVLGRAAQNPVAPVQRFATERTLRTDLESQTAATKLVGREAELARLWAALRDAERGRPVVVHVRGPSGTGKSALVEQFLDDVEDAESHAQPSDALVLRSRCYELEAMPFKALDGVMDALVRYLSRLDDLAVAHVMPAEIRALTQLFPALERLSAVQHLLGSKASPRDAILERQLAEVALRSLLDAVAMRTPVVVWIDDLQWGDLDSARILQNWLQQPSRAQILFVFSYRSAEMETSPCLVRLLHRDAVANDAVRASEHVIELLPLGTQDIRALCEQRLGELARSHSGLIDRIAREAQGSPFLASQLVAVAQAKFARGDRDWSNLTIEALVEQTRQFLPPEAQTLLWVLAVAGRPMLPKLALQAAGIGKQGRAFVHALRGLNLVRSRDINGERMLEIYHDRVRESIRDALDQATSLRMFKALFVALEFSGRAEPDFLHTLALGAGEHAAALSYGYAAAERATEALAFERAAEVYKACVSLAGAAALSSLWQKLAVALGRCGRGAQAAEAYLESAKHVEPREAVLLTQMAAGHLLRCGHYARGIALVDQVMADMDIHLPASEVGFKAAIVWERVRLALRGRSFQLRAPDEVAAELLARHDVFENLGSGIMQFDPLRATLLQLRGLRCALDAGEADRLVHALCRVALSASVRATPKAVRESDLLLDRAHALARQAAPHAQGVVTSSRALACYFIGRHRDVLEYSRAALHELSTDADLDTRGNYFRRHAVAAIRLGALYTLAEYPSLINELQALLQEARDTDNLALVLSLSFLHTLVEEILDQQAESRARLDREREQLPSLGFGTTLVLHLSSVMSVACATGEYAWAWSRLDAEWERFQRSPIARGGWLATGMYATRARMLLNQNVAQGSEPSRTKAAGEALGWLGKRAGNLGARRVAARLAYARGDVPATLSELRASIASFDGIGMAADAARDRYALGAVLGGAEGAALREAALRKLGQLGVVNPPVNLRAYYPEFVAAP